MSVQPDALQRFLDAQEGVVDRAFDELRRGRKSTHWMWFVFPQLVGLGRSRMAQYYGIGNAAEAAAYWRHPVLGERLRLGVGLVCGHRDRSAREIFGGIDAVKFRSCLTLFLEVAQDADSDLLVRALAQFYGGEKDPKTLELLASPADA